MIGRLKDMVASGAALDGLKEVLTPGAAVEKAQQLLHDFNETVPTLKALGLSVSDMSFRMGIPPEIAASLIGAIEALDEASIREVKDRHKENQVVGLILEGLILASTFKGQLTSLGFAGIRVDLKLGLLPSVQVGLLTSAAASAEAARAAFSGVVARGALAA
jgi:hypothetical protein